MENKFKKSMENIRTHLEYGFPEEDELMCERCNEELDVLQELVDKSISKRPDVIRKYDENIPICPFCKRELVKETYDGYHTPNKEHHCECGQSLNWEEYLKWL